MMLTQEEFSSTVNTILEYARIGGFERITEEETLRLYNNAVESYGKEKAD